MTTPTRDIDESAPRIRNKHELVERLEQGAKPASQWRVGTEHEKFGFLRADHRPLPYDGPAGIEAILNTIATDRSIWEKGRSWRAIQEDGRTIALFCEDDSAITLEPGGQIELSGAPLASLHQTCDEINRHLALLRRACLPRDIGFIGMGFHPTARYEDIPTVPKSRYRVMQRYMPTRGTRGLDMMKRTATVQANLDFDSEADMVASFRTALAVTPIVAALFANGAFKEGRPSGVLSERLLVWTDTDPDRSGFPAVVLEPGFGYERWVQWVLDVPIYFVRRDYTHHDFAGVPFRQFLEKGLDGYRATLRDFADHLTTIFTEVRLKRYLEVRTADSGPWSRICALPALWKGVLYDRGARDAAWALMDGPSVAELRALQAQVVRLGLAARYRGRSVLELARELLAISAAGLERIGCRNSRGEDERLFLRPLEQTVAEGRTFAERLLARFHGDWRGSIEPLWEDFEFFPESETIE
jgi:glutamate--cysteine ligase